MTGNVAEKCASEGGCKPVKDLSRSVKVIVGFFAATVVTLVIFFGGIWANGKEYEKDKPKIDAMWVEAADVKERRSTLKDHESRITKIEAKIDLKLADINNKLDALLDMKKEEKTK